VLATARHASRRVDDQLRGRSGRQGEPGFSQFYLSLDDELLEIFATPIARSLVARAATDRSAPISHRAVSKLIATAQEKLESTHREARRTTNEFATAVVEQQRVVYAWRDGLLDETPRAAVESVLTVAFRRLLAEREAFAEAFNDPFDDAFDTDIGEDGASSSEPSDVSVEMSTLPDGVAAIVDRGAVSADEVLLSFTDNLVIDWFDAAVRAELATAPDPARLASRCVDAFAARNAHVDHDLTPVLRSILLARLDELWVQHLDTLDAIRDAARLRATAQRDPRIEFVRDASEHFEQTLGEFFTTAGRLVSCGLLRPGAAPAPV
jgi:preprotein translocase subunit SecA